MNPIVRRYLEENMDLLDSGIAGFMSLYEKSINYATELSQGDLTGMLTQVLLDAGIKPLAELPYVPDYYMYMYQDSTLNTVEIPEHIERIGKSAFEYCDELIEIVIPENVKEIESFAFANCFRLAMLEIKNPKLLLGLNTFESKISHIRFNGTWEEWQHFCKMNAWMPAVNNLVCQDKHVAIDKDGNIL